MAMRRLENCQTSQIFSKFPFYNSSNDNIISADWQNRLIKSNVTDNKSKNILPMRVAKEQ